MADFDNSMDNLEPQDPEIEYAYRNWAFDVHYYGTGSTTPPRDYYAMMSGFLITTIVLCGMVTILGLMGIQWMAEPVREPETNDISVSFIASQGEIPTGLEQRPAQEETDDEARNDGNKNYAGLEEQLDFPISESQESLDNVAGQEGALSWQDVYEQLIPSVVSITCTGEAGTTGGSGVIMTDSGYILTNAHVVDDAVAIQVLLTDGRTFAGSIVGMDEQSDLAVIDIEVSGLTPAQFGDSGALRVGDEVVAIGDPLGIELRGTMTKGIVSGISRDLTVGNRTMTLIQTTAALNSGNSGGPLVNCYGQVVGINTMKLTGQIHSAAVEGLGFAIPTATIQSIVQQLVDQGYVSGRPMLGITGEMVSSFYQHYYRLPAGLLVGDVDSDSDAAKKGLHSGDIILYIDGTRITDLDTCESLIDGHEVGDTVIITVYRNGHEYDVAVRLMEAQG